jgi:DNA-directed RNA polymerase III subunit RPC2
LCTLLLPSSPQPTGRHRLLDRDGIARPGEVLQPGDIYVNKQMPVNTRDPIQAPGAMPDSFYKSTPLSWKVRDIWFLST